MNKEECRCEFCNYIGNWKEFYDMASAEIAFWFMCPMCYSTSIETETDE